MHGFFATSKKQLPGWIIINIELKGKFDDCLKKQKQTQIQIFFFFLEAIDSGLSITLLFLLGSFFKFKIKNLWLGLKYGVEFSFRVNPQIEVAYITI